MRKGKLGKYLIILLVIILLIVVGYYLFKFVFSELSFDLKNDNIELRVGDTTSVKYELNKRVSILWETEDSNIVSIDNGKITALNVGYTIIKGTVTKGDRTITRKCRVTTYHGDKGVALNDVTIDGSELFISKGDSYKIPVNYSPINAYVDSIEYSVAKPVIADFNGTVTAKNKGITDITMTFNKKITKTITVNVTNSGKTPVLGKKIDQITTDFEAITLNPNEKREIKYNILPKDAYIDSITWESSDLNVAYIDNGLLTAKSSGKAVISLLINNRILKEIDVTVSVPVTGIELVSSANMTLRVGVSDTIKAKVLPANATNQKLTYTSSNPSILKVDDNGVVTPLATGSGTITVKTSDGNYKVDIPFVVNAKNGVINGNGGIWGYSSSHDKVPTRADVNYFRTLASKGKGTLSNNTYIYNDGKRVYKYDIATSTLTADNRNILMRIYYPEGVDLSSVNTFTFFGGSGELGFGGYLSHLDKNRGELISSGIIILVSGRNNYAAEDGVLSTEFVKSIVNQKSGIKNTVGGYSLSGQAAGKAANIGQYSRLIIVNSYINTGNNYTNNLHNKEIVFYSPVGDHMSSRTINALNGMVNGNFNLTVVSNNSDIVNNSRYQNSYRIINPGTAMGRGHGYANISTAKVFSYACS